MTIDRIEAIRGLTLRTLIEKYWVGITLWLWVAALILMDVKAKGSQEGEDDEA